MRKILMGLTVLAGAVVAASGVDAAPRFMAPVSTVTSAAVVQPVRYHEDWRYREWRRREELERFRRHEEWRHERHEAREHRRHGW